jgi:hypothetical protein
LTIASNSVSASCGSWNHHRVAVAHVGRAQPAAHHAAEVPARLEQRDRGPFARGGNGRHDAARGAAVDDDVVRARRAAMPARPARPGRPGGCLGRRRRAERRGAEQRRNSHSRADSHLEAPFRPVVSDGSSVSSRRSKTTVPRPNDRGTVLGRAGFGAVGSAAAPIHPVLVTA